MVKENLIWFSWGYGRWPTQDIVVNVTQSPGLVFLPNVKNDLTGQSTIIIRNNSMLSNASIGITYITSGSATHSNFSYSIPPNGQKVVNPLPGFSGSATVYGNQNVSAVVKNTYSDDVTIYNGLKASGGGLGWEQVGTTLYAPVVKHNWAGRSSDIIVLNTGSANTNVTAHFYDRNTGNEYSNPPVISNLAPNARATIAASAKCPSSNFCAVALVSSAGQPLAAVVQESASGGSDPTTHNVFASATAQNYVPIVKNNYGGQTTGLVVYNTSNQQSTVTVTYYDAQSSATYVSSASVPRHALASFYDPAGLPDNFIGSAKVSASQPLVTAVHESGNGRYKAANSVLGGLQPCMCRS
jgi:hypothetical protein